MGPREDVMPAVHEEILDIGRRAGKIDRDRIVKLVNGLECLRDPYKNLVTLVMTVRINNAQPPVRKQDHDAVVVVIPPGPHLQVPLPEGPAGHVILGDAGIAHGGRITPPELGFVVVGRPDLGTEPPGPGHIINTAHFLGIIVIDIGDRRQTSYLGTADKRPDKEESNDENLLTHLNSN